MFRIGQVVGELIERFEVIAQQHCVCISEVMTDHLHLLVCLEVVHDGGGTLQRIHIIFRGIRMHIHRFRRIDVLVSRCRLRRSVVLLLAYQSDAECAVAAVNSRADGRVYNLGNLSEGT